MKRFTTATTKNENALNHLRNALKAYGVDDAQPAVDFCLCGERLNRAWREANPNRVREPLPYARRQKPANDARRADYYATAIRQAITLAKRDDANGFTLYLADDGCVTNDATTTARRLTIANGTATFAE